MTHTAAPAVSPPRGRPRLASRALLAGATAPLFGLGLASPVTAAEGPPPTTFVVSSTLDERDVDLADDVCDSDSGLGVRCTLRAAVMQANVSPGSFVIQLEPRLYRLTLPSAGEDLSRTGDLDLVGKIEIVGQTAPVGRFRTTIDASAVADRVIDGRSSGAILRNVVLTGGRLPATTGLSTEFDGGGVRNGGTLAVHDSLLRGNTAARGGGLASLAGNLTVARTIVTGNSATAPDTGLVADGGGGLFIINTTATVLESTIRANTSAFSGGGIGLAPIFFPSQGIKVVRSLVADNTAVGPGGGIDVVGTNDGSFRLDNSTISGNHSAAHGGGVAIRSLKSEGKMTLFESTIAGNSSKGFYGGISTDSFLTSGSIYGVILANNAPANCDSSAWTGSHNLSTDWSCSFSEASLRLVSARLGPLADNGGPTHTHALLPDSPAIDAAGYPSPGFVHDQRGRLRIRSGLGIDNPHDMGAVESNPTFG